MFASCRFVFIGTWSPLLEHVAAKHIMSWGHQDVPRIPPHNCWDTGYAVIPCNSLVISLKHVVEKTASSYAPVSFTSQMVHFGPKTSLSCADWISRGAAWRQEWHKSYVPRHFNWQLQFVWRIKSLKATMTFLYFKLKVKLTTLHSQWLNVKRMRDMGWTSIWKL